MAKETLNLEVKSNIKSVTKESDELAESLGKSVDETKDLGSELESAGTSGKKGFALVTGGVKAFGLALKAAGIGLVIAILASLKEALERNQTVMNAVNTIMTTLSTTFNQVVVVLTEVYTWVTDSSERFDGLTTVITSLMTLALTPLKLAFYSIKLAIEGLLLAWEDSFLGGGDEARIIALSESIRGTADDIKAVGEAAIEAGGEIVSNIGDAIGEISDIGTQAVKGLSKISIKSNFEMAKATTAAGNASKLAEAQIQGLIEKYDRQAELQRHIRDSEKATFAERITANDEIAKILKKQKTEMLALADTRVASAKLERDANKDNVDLEVAYQQTLNDRAGVLAQIAGFASEQKTNEESLDKELAETKKQIAQDSIDGIDRELLELKNAYELKLDMARKANVSDLELTEQYLKDKKAIEDAAAKEDEEREDAKNSAKLSSQLAFGKASAGAIGALSTLAKEGSTASKALALTEIAVNTGLGIIQGLDIAQKSAKATGPAAALAFPIFFATQLAAVLGAAAQAKSALNAGGGGGPGPGPGPAPPAVPPAPQMMSGAFELTGGQAVEPTRAYVVSDDITANQNKLAIIRRRATI